ncbi:MAG TPA: NAD(P)-dependent alcohol dehydrogenase [Candidatus Bathyarchaeia archaeon]|nr:NAD(P)-dependent alcohol dehydrogenase [Candidatus Bathyarchaeia archaeon]
MKAIVCTRYGPPEVLQLKEIEKPSPKENEVLIRVHATTVTAGDVGLRSLRFPLLSQPLVRVGFGFRGPRMKILGQEVAGEIESVGGAVKMFGKGDQVFAWTGFHLCGYAEYICLREGGVLANKPANMGYDEAATLGVGGLEAWRLFRKGNVQSAERVLINGAGGSIGTYAVQIAKYYGAEVTGVDSTGKLDMLRSIGAHHVIDYTQADFTRNGETYDVIFDVIGTSSFSRSLRSLKQNGRYLLGNPRLSHMIRGGWVSRRTSKKVIFGGTGRAEDLWMLKELVEKGGIVSVIDRRYPLEETAEAHRYVDTGKKKGNVIITVGKMNESGPA